ncbi:UNVERIFIED_CONTAM: Transglutaminase-like enzymes, putative cysteine proteases [Acetivibrio alkalicellulosi]
MDNYNKNSNNNLIKLFIFLSVALLSTLLIMAAISLLDLPDTGESEGENNSQSALNDQNDVCDSSNQKEEQNKTQAEGQNDSQNGNDNEGQNGNQDLFQNDNWKEEAHERKERSLEGDRDQGDFETEREMGEYYPQEGEGRSTQPDMGRYGEGFPDDAPNIDISGNWNMPDTPFDTGGRSLKMSGEKQPHIPMFEVMGIPSYPFLKVLVMENYSNSRWIVSQEEADVKLMLGMEKERKFLPQSLKIKPIEPSRGYLPVLSGNIVLKYDYSLLKYKNSGTYFSDNVINDFYEIVYDTPPTIAQLQNTPVDSSYYYEMIYTGEIEQIIDDIIQNSNSDYEAIKYVEEYLTKNYVYNNSIINNYGNIDGIKAFLLSETREGNYMDFISAYTFILRALGIPCRLVVGYRIYDDKPYQIVYSDQKYVYPEIKFKDYGWVPFDVFPNYPFYTPPEPTITEITYADSTAKRGTSFTVRGTVTDINGNLLDDMQVLIYVKEDKDTPTLSYQKAYVENGYFEIECDIISETGTGSYQVVAELLENDTYRTSSSDPELKVYTDTIIELHRVDSLQGKAIEIEGRIIDSYSNEGVEGLLIKVFLDESEDSYEFISQKDGEFLKQLDININDNSSHDKNIFFAKSYLVSYSAEFEGTEFYNPSSVSGTVTVWRLVHNRILIAFIIFLLLLIVCGYIVFRKIRNLPNPQNNQPILDGVGNEFFTTTFNNNSRFIKTGRKLKFFIEYPNIKEKLPDVWGVDDQLIVRFSDEYGNSDKTEITFHRKGKYAFKFISNEETLISRQIRIVVYREEVISIGNIFLKDVLNITPEINSTMTLREIFGLLKRKAPKEKHNILESMFNILEKAVYSKSDIVREDYELIYDMIENYRPYDMEE